MGEIISQIPEKVVIKEDKSDETELIKKPEKKERETVEPIYAEKSAKFMLEIQQTLPEISFDNDDHGTIGYETIERIRKLYEKYAKNKDVPKFIKNGLKRILEVIKNSQGIKLGKHKIQEMGEEMNVFDSYLSTTYLFENPESVANFMKRKHPRYPEDRACRVSGINLPTKEDQRNVLVAREKDVPFSQVIRHEDWHSWQKKFNLGWKDGFKKNNIVYRQLFPNDLKPKDFSLHYGDAGFIDYHGMEYIYDSGTQDRYRMELSAFFCEGVDKDTLREKFTGPLEQDNYDFSDPTLYTLLRLKGYQDLEDGFDFISDDSEKHYKEMTLKVVDIYFDLLEKYQKANPDLDEKEIRKFVADYLLFARTKDMRKFSDYVMNLPLDKCKL